MDKVVCAIDMKSGAILQVVLRIKRRVSSDVQSSDITRNISCWKPMCVWEMKASKQPLQN